MCMSQQFNKYRKTRKIIHISQIRYGKSLSIPSRVVILSRSIFSRKAGLSDNSFKEGIKIEESSPNDFKVC